MTKSKPRKKPNRSAILTGGVLLIIPPLIALWVAFEGRGLRDEPVRATFDKRLSVSSPAPTPVPTPAKNGQGIAGWKPAPQAPPAPSRNAGHVIAEALLPAVAADAIYHPTDPPAHWNSETVYEKINGAAPEYLDLGFRELLTQEYPTDDPDLFGCEVYIYDLAKPENARKIYEQQGGAPNVTKVDIGESGYRFGATWFFHQGPYYVIVLNSDEGAKAEQFSETLARGLTQRIAAQGTKVD